MKSINPGIGKQLFDLSEAIRERTIAIQRLLSDEVDKLDSALFTERKALDALCNCGDCVQQIVANKDKADLSLAEAALWLREPEKMGGDPNAP